MRLATRIALSTALVVPLLVLGAGAALLGLITHDLRNQQNGRLRDRAAAVMPDARTLLNADQQGRTRVAENQHRKVLDAALDVGVRVADANGTLVTQGGPQPADSVALPAPGGGPTTVRSWRVLAVRIAGANPGTLWVFEPTSVTDPQVAAVRGRVLLIALLAAPLSGLLALAVAGRATAPLRRLGRRAAELDPRAGAAGFGRERTGVGDVDELAAVLESVLARYDEQAGRTAQALETARSFSAAASHELRTPLMSMQTNLDVLNAHPDLSPAERADILADLRGDHRRLLELLTALRTLARGDLVEVEAFGPLDLAEPAEAAVGEMRRRRPEVQLWYVPEVAGGARVFGWDAGLRIVCDNLLANAVAHGRTPGEPCRITVRLGREDGQAVLTVDDAGPGIPPEQRAAVFDRFHRRRDSPGSGLGLTLVAQQVALHRGTVTVSTPPGGTGCRIEVRLPLLLADAPTVALPARRDWIGAAAGVR
ncbi:two-component system sensor histidine kinase PrrB [Kitasatospora sp. MAA4]|uniref:sensor histidine kinase n=1 Tax=Kitasatospora sp. MAA4 TaxID=3035093 RepID=UPI002476D435|nr:HAMP domain-containing sensor histidine kinase [Kitasatospora sp. MAA4]MDH6136798.1 two-component system sensor histidine kinase PrrB [Kitasatospora sp. MAA4]